MISPHTKFENLNPDTWKNLGKLTSAFFAKGSILWLLVNEGEIVKSTLNNQLVIINEEASSSELFSSFPDADYIIRVDRDSLISYYSDVNYKIEQKISIDEFYSFMVDHLTDFPLITYTKRDEKMIPPPMWVNPYEVFDRLIRDNLPPSCCIYYEISEGKNIWFTVYAEIHNYVLTFVSSDKKDNSNKNTLLFTRHFQKDHVIKTISKLAYGEYKESL